MSWNGENKEPPIEATSETNTGSGEDESDNEGSPEDESDKKDGRS